MKNMENFQIKNSNSGDWTMKNFTKILMRVNLFDRNFTSDSKLIDSEKKAKLNNVNFRFNQKQTHMNFLLETALFQSNKGKNHFITTKLENKSVLDTFHILEQQGFEVDYLQKNGQELLGELHSKLKTNTSLVSVAFCNPKNGVIQPISEISKICQKNETLFHTDASKIIGKIPMNVDDLHVNLLSFSSKEIIQNEDFDIIYTGNDFPFKFSQNEFSKEEKSSLQDFAEAIEFLQLNMMNDIEIMKNLSMKLFTKLKEELRFIEIVCESEKRNPGILNVNFKYVGNGLKKSEYAFVPSRVVKSKNRNVLCASTGTTEIVDESLTFNFNRFATEKEIDSIAKTVIKEVQNIREKSSMYKLFCKMNPE